MSNRSGTYQVVHGRVQQVSNAIPTLQRAIYVPKGDVPHYDPGLRMQIESKAHKRQVLQEAGLREGGIVQPGKRWEGSTRNRTKMSWASQQRQQRAQAHVAAQGGTQGLLDRIQRGAGQYV